MTKAQEKVLNALRAALEDSLYAWLSTNAVSLQRFGSTAPNRCRATQQSLFALCGLGLVSQKLNDTDDLVVWQLSPKGKTT